MYLNAIIKNEKTMDVSREREHEIVQVPLRAIEMIKGVNRNIVNESTSIVLAYCSTTRRNGQGLDGTLLELEHFRNIISSIQRINTNPFMRDTGLIVLNAAGVNTESDIFANQTITSKTLVIKRDDVTSVVPSNAGYSVSFSNKLAVAGSTTITYDCKRDILDNSLFHDRIVVNTKEFYDILNSTRNTISFIKRQLLDKDFRGQVFEGDSFKSITSAKDAWNVIRYSFSHIINTIVLFGYSGRNLSDQALETHLSDIAIAYDVITKNNPAIESVCEDYNVFREFVTAMSSKDRPIIDKLQFNKYPEQATNCNLTLIDIKLYLFQDVDRAERIRHEMLEYIPDMKQRCFSGGYTPKHTIADTIKYIKELYREINVYEWYTSFTLDNISDFDLMIDFIKNR